MTPFERPLRTASTIGCDLDIEAELSEVQVDQLGDVLVVLDDEDSLSHIGGYSRQQESRKYHATRRDHERRVVLTRFTRYARLSVKNFFSLSRGELLTLVFLVAFSAFSFLPIWRRLELAGMAVFGWLMALLMVLSPTLALVAMARRRRRR